MFKITRRALSLALAITVLLTTAAVAPLTASAAGTVWSTNGYTYDPANDSKLVAPQGFTLSKERAPLDPLEEGKRGFKELFIDDSNGIFYGVKEDVKDYALKEAVYEKLIAGTYPQFCTDKTGDVDFLFQADGYVEMYMDYAGAVYKEIEDWADTREGVFSAGEGAVVNFIVISIEEDGTKVLSPFTVKFGVKGAGAPGAAPSSWAKENVDKANTLGLVTDALKNNYQAPTTRLEFCKAVVNLLDKFGYHAYGLNTGKGFSDTTDIGVLTAAALGIVNGTDTAKNTFSPDQTLTREQAATMLRNVLNVIGADTKTSGVKWKDAADISSYAKEASDVMFTSKIMGGTSSTENVFSPKTAYTHEQSILTLVNLWNYAESVKPSSTKTAMRILNVTPTTYTADKETTFTVQVWYNWAETKRGFEVAVGANTEKADGYLHYDTALFNLDELSPINGSKTLPTGIKTFTVTCAPKNWGDKPFFIAVNMSEAPHGDSWTPLASDRWTFK